ncbi:MAG TPA: orotidine-5'-phosphate decarboxylase [Candidatus Paceibacterota bacterium]
MGTRNFRELLEARWAADHFVCVGLDSDYPKIPGIVREQQDQVIGASILAFNRAIIDATHDLVGAYKPNIAFYAAYGRKGLAALRDIIGYIHFAAPETPVILDAKRADIGNTNAGYVLEAFDYLDADAITVHPYLGAEALQPFLDREDKGVFILCRTSNPGAGEFQNMQVPMPPGRYAGKYHHVGPHFPLYQPVAHRVATEWNKNSNCGLVVGATYPKELREVRALAGDIPILIPGIGAQGGDVEATIGAGMDSHGAGMIINSSRGIIFASSGADFADAARLATLELHTLINQYRKVVI